MLAETKIRREDHPVWVVYNMQRTACLNLKYYGHKLRQKENLSKIIDVVIALVAPTSAIASLPMWEIGLGKQIWAWVPAIATILVVLRSVLKLGNHVKDLEKRVTSYQALSYDLRKISDKIYTDRKFSATLLKQYEAAIERQGAVMRLPPIEEDRQLIDRLQEEVNQLYPAANFYVPEE